MPKTRSDYERILTQLRETEAALLDRTEGNQVPNENLLHQLDGTRARIAEVTAAMNETLE